MARIIKRISDLAKIRELQKVFPIVGIMGPRQCGKTFLAKTIPYQHYFDLENPRDLARLENPQIVLEGLKGTIIIDEIQRKPDLFPVLRYLADTAKRQKYLILGSASPSIIKHSSESLAGRIGYYHLGGLTAVDVGERNRGRLWIRGGFPRAYLAGSDRDAFLWLSEYLTTVIERDVPQLGFSIPARALKQFWAMLSHYHGQIVNYAEIGRSFGMTDMTIRRYISLLEGMFMVRVLQPWHTNVSKRLVKRPKIYIRDSGIFHSLQMIGSLKELESHPKLGASWEGFAVEQVAKMTGMKDEELFFWATHAGAEVDLFWRNGGGAWAVECKYAGAPSLTPSIKAAVKDLDLKHLWVVYPGTQGYSLSKEVSVVPFASLGDKWEYKVAQES